MKPDTEKILSILASHENDPSNLIAILQDVQAEYNYLSEANLTLIADTLGLSVSKVYSVATFYENFSLEAKGKHIVKVCAGTACHVRKSGPIYDAIYEYLGLHGKKKTSDDGLFTLETVACLGACGLAPVMTVDGEVHAKMDPERAIELLESIRKEPRGAVHPHLRGHGLHRRRRNENLRQFQIRVRGARAEGLRRLEARLGRGKEPARQNERLPRLLRDGPARAHRADGCDVHSRQARGLPRDPGKDRSGRRDHRPPGVPSERRGLSPAGGHSFL